jgi:hypothetical protein
MCKNKMSLQYTALSQAYNSSADFSDNVPETFKFSSMHSEGLSGRQSMATTGITGATRPSIEEELTEKEPQKNSLLRRFIMRFFVCGCRGGSKPKNPQVIT